DIGYFYGESEKALDMSGTVIDTIPSIPKVNKNQQAIDKLQRQIDSLKSVDN
ncbi:MAG: hypothetical protein HKM99_03135, partial [Flavobacteriaceae bacterium]|nr:hypothetical protein [Flavobacteriaceae bacterium]